MGRLGLASVIVALTGCAIGPMRMIDEPPEKGASAGSVVAVSSATRIAAESLDVRFAREDVIRVVHDPKGNATYPDLVTLKGRKQPERGLVLETTLASVLVRLPWGAADGAQPPRSARPAAKYTGVVSGRVTHRRRSVAGCEVRLQALEQWTFLGLFHDTRRRGLTRVTRTDARGVFAFDDLPDGPYRLAFRRHPGKGYWLLRLREVPVDAVVHEGGSQDVGVIDLGRPVLR